MCSRMVSHDVLMMLRSANEKQAAAHFYSKHRFYSLADLQDQLKRYNREYNHTPMRPLGWKSPNQYLADYFNNKSVTDV